MQRIDLTGPWQFKAEDRPLPANVRGIGNWMAARVPGTVHTDLLAARKIADPFYRTNENELQWIDLIRWRYRRQFTVPTALLRERTVRLVAEGIDTFAEIRINDRVIGTTANMFVGHEFDVREALHAGRNTIEILFDSPTLRPKALETEYGPLQVVLEPYRAYARKAQYSYGWDWGPKLTTSGIWRPIRIEAFSHPRFRDPFVRVIDATDETAHLQIAASVEHPGQGALMCEVRIAGGTTLTRSTGAVAGGKVSVDITLQNPRLWWPHGHGDQPLYSAEIALLEGGDLVDTVSLQFGIRTVRLVQESDDEGRSFVIEVNGKKIFCKGADWIPCDVFLPRIEDNTYRRLLTLARDASMNMIRVWGGGIYESDLFYELCDRLGLMVWQDFMYACGEYPDHEAFLQEAHREAVTVVRRLRNHTSIVLWCGNNECEWLFCAENPGKGPDDMRGARIFRDVIPAALHETDGTRPYVRSTPFGDGFPNAEQNGNHHQWEVWSRWKDYREYRNVRARFVSEFGFQAPACQKTLERAMLPEDRAPQSRVMEHHNKQVEGPERLFRFQSGHYTVSGDWEDFIHKGQLVQAEALKCAVEHWRRRKFQTAGSLFWQLNDCWPVNSWSVVDSDLRPKAGYFYAKRFFAPLLVSIVRRESGLEVWGTSDLARDVRGRLSVDVLEFTGKVVWHKALSTRVAADSSVCMFTIPDSITSRADPAKTYVRAQLHEGRERLSENRFFFLEPKHLALPAIRPRVIVRKSAPGEYRAIVSSKGFALSVYLSSEIEGVQFHDNFLDVDPGSSVEIPISAEIPLAELRRSLRIRALNPRSALDTPRRGKSLPLRSA